MITCPVCPKTDIPDASERCPGCGTDLSPIQRIRELSDAQLNEAVRLSEVGAYDMAIARVMSALALDGCSVPARTLLGKLLWQTERPKDAVRQWKQAAAAAPQDLDVQRLLQAAQRELRNRNWRRRGAIAAGGLAALSVVFLAGYLPWRSSTQQVAVAGRELSQLKADLAGSELQRTEETTRVAAQLADVGQVVTRLESLAVVFADYRTSHQHSNAEYASAVRAAEELQSNLLAAQNSLGEERSFHDRLVAEVSTLQQELTKLEQAQHQAEASLNEVVQALRGLANREMCELRSQMELLQTQQVCTSASVERIGCSAAAALQVVTQLREDLAQTRTADEIRQVDFKDALRPFIESLRPADADQLETRIRHLREELQRLRRTEAQCQLESGQPFNGIRLAWIRGELHRVESMLQSLEAQYAARVTPWNRAVAALAPRGTPAGPGK